MLIDRTGVEGLPALEDSAVEHTNASHHDSIDLYARLAGYGGSGWRLIGIDPEGLDLANGNEVTRLWFAERLVRAADLRSKLVDLAQASISEQG